MTSLEWIVIGVVGAVVAIVVTLLVATRSRRLDPGSLSAQWIAQQRSAGRETAD